MRDLQDAIAAWQGGAANAVAYDQHIDTSRALFAEMVGVPTDWVAIGSQVSPLVGMVASALPAGSRVVCPEGEFTSVLFPFLIRDDLAVTLVPLEELASAIASDTDMVAFSLVQSADGRVADVDGIVATADRCGAMTMVDATQGAGWLPFSAGRFDITVTGTYKWLMCPRGTAFMTVRPEAMDRVTVLYPGWYAGEAPWDSIYGAPLRLAESARRFDASPAWLNWVGTAASLRLILDIGVDAIHEHNVSLANAFRSRVGLSSSDSAIVSIDLPATTDMEALAQLSTAQRAGRLRVGFHLYNTIADVDLLAAALT